MLPTAPSRLSLWLTAAADWHAEHGNLRVPYRYETASGVKLGQWMCRQRVLRRRGRLNPSVASVLDALDGRWHATTPARFAAEFGALARFREDFGHTLVPARYVTADGIRLGPWFARQRRLGRSGNLPAQRAEALAALDVDFVRRIPHNPEVSAYLAECYRWFQVHSHLRIPAGFTSNGMAIGRWLVRQRFADRRGTISARIASELDAIDTTWPDPTDRTTGPVFTKKAERQQVLIEAAKAFHEAAGHLRVPSSHLHEGLHLGAFIYRCRRDAGFGRLDQDVLEALGKIDPHWSDRSGVPHRYRHMLDAATAYQASHGNLLVPKAYVSPGGTGLGWWLSDRRNQMRKGTLNPSLSKALDAIDPAWADLRNAAEGRRLASDAVGLLAIREFTAKHGHACIPLRYKTSAGFALGAWLARRRKDHRQGALGRILLDELSALGVVWAPEPRTSKGSELRPDPSAKYIGALRTCLETGGLNRIPSKYVTDDGLLLGRWLERQRAAFRKGKLRSSIKLELHALGVDLELPRRTRRKLPTQRE